MQFRLLLFLCLSNTAFICSKTTLNIENTLDSTENASTDNGISTLVAASFLKEIKASIKKSWYNSDEKDLSMHEKLAKRLESECSVNFHDVKMTLRKEEYEDHNFIIIETDLRGTTDDFQYKNILEYEKNTLKFILIKKYLDNFTLVENQNCISIPLDNQTKTTQLPSFLIVSISNGIMGSQQSYSKDHMGMTFITYFTIVEFDSLIQKYYIDNQSHSIDSAQTTKKTWWLW